MSAVNNIRYTIDDLLLDTQLGTLRRDDSEIPLPQLSYRLLCVLVEHAPAIISQDELMNQVWTEQVVSDETLKQRIKLLRQALDDSPQAPKYIESVRGRGYRCVADVKKTIVRVKPLHDGINLRLNDRLPVSVLHGSEEYWRLIGLFFSATLLIVVATLAINSLLVGQYEPTDTPTKINQITTDSPAQPAYDKGRVFYLRYQSMDNEMAIKSFKRATELDPAFAPAFAGLADAYSQGVFQFSGQDSWRKLALEAAYDAVILDDSSAQSYKSLGNAHYVSGHISQSLSANLKAVELNEKFVEAQASLGYIYSERGELSQALSHHITVLKLDSNYQVNWFHIALTLHRLNQPKLALKWFEHIVKHQPNYHLATYHFSHLLMQQGNKTQAQTLLQQAHQRSPDSLNILKGLIDFHLLNDDLHQASQWFRKLQLPANGENRQYAELLSLIADSDNNQDEISRWYALHSGEYDETPFHSIQLAMAANALGKQNGAFRHLTEAVELGWLDSFYLNHLVFFKALRQTPKFNRILQLIERKRNKQTVSNYHPVKQLPTN